MIHIGIVILSVATAAGTAQARPHVRILATGGTIAGQARAEAPTAYQAGVLTIDAIIEAVPELREVADISAEQVANVASQDMTDTLWLTLRRRVDAALASGASGVVITHGTDTLEETALFLHLTSSAEAPVVLTGSMRPPDAAGADGPANLLDGVRVAAHSASRGRGVLVVMNDTIHAAAHVTKSHTTAPHTFRSPNGGAIGFIDGKEPRYLHARKPPATVIHELEGRTALPHVAVIYAHANVDAGLIDAAVSQGARGIVLAGVGNGNGSRAVLAALDRARRRGLVIVRSTRVGSGWVDRNVEINDDARQFVAAGFLNPQQARVLLAVVLTATYDIETIQQAYFTMAVN
jgi:L-asparaginase